jgi:acylglycerol lipase
MSEASFSFTELNEASKNALAPVELLRARDGIKLAYRRYEPEVPRAALLFYHGGGAHSGASYQHLGHGLQTQFDTLVYMPDIRGHGASDGPRGDTPSAEQVWADITTFLAHIHARFPHLPLFLGGHSSGAGLALNYASRPGHTPVDGYVFLSPQLGVYSQTARPDLAAPFAIVDAAAFANYATKGSPMYGHVHAVRFNYPAEVLAADPGLVASITVNMANALTPYAPRDQFVAIDHPFGLWIGEEDELFLPEKVLAYGTLAVSVRAASRTSSIPNAKHLTVLLKAYEVIGPWIMQMIHSQGPILT